MAREIRGCAEERCDIVKDDSTQHACDDLIAANQAGSFYASIKPFLTIDDQVARLEEHGIQIKDRDFVIACLSEANYYRIRAYWMTFEDDDGVLPGIPFETIWALYQLDEALRLWVWQQVGPIEIKARTQFAYQMARACGPLSYLDSRFFADEGSHAKTMKSFQRELSRAQKNRAPCVVHNLEKYGKLPVWAAVEIMPMGLVSSLFGNLNRGNGGASLSATEEICASFGAKYTLLKSWLHHLTDVRNVCGHHNRFYGRVTNIRPKLLRQDRRYTSDREFPTFLVLKRMYEKSWPRQWEGALSDLVSLFDKNVDVDVRPMGFPDAWQKVLGF